ncbi:hypothetical protein OFY17_10035 [Marinomonas sp. C2222]|uniref:Uncharacterized protein n=1 Tax=Marinomonas sargassi TaxID=2984494 RepID=A0ABT2YTJ8_9GAMM|nr:hypothetical protein [Marinomonas sargassi]MCV2403217.1 hypothetical protein [Marinomonas sargassi]
MIDWGFDSGFMQALVILVMLGQVFVSAKIVLQASGAEQFVRMTAVSAGLLLFLGSKAFGITFADLMLIAVTDASLLKVLSIATIIPIVVGIIVSQITISAMNSGEDFAIRIVLLISVLMLTQISYLNYFVLTKTSLPLDQALLPNLCYSLSVCLWAVFNFKDSGQFHGYNRY